MKFCADDKGKKSKYLIRNNTRELIKNLKSTREFNELKMLTVQTARIDLHLQFS